MSDDDEAPGTFASPPCFMHEVDPAYGGVWPADAAPPSEAELARIGQALLRDLPDAVIHADAGGTIRYWNAGAERIFGHSAAEALGRPLDIIIPERLRQRHWDGYRQMMATGKSRYGPDEILSVPAVTKAGESLSVQFTLAPVPDADGRVAGVVALLRDSTETFQELKRLRAAARAAEAKPG